MEAEEEIPLELLNIELNVEPVAESDIFLSLEGNFRPAKPNIVQRLIIYNRDQVDEKPVRLYTQNYSASNELQSKGAFLLVLYRVTDKGRTENIHILDSNSEEATEIARKIIKSSRFRPAKKNGHTVNVWVEHEMIFKEDKLYSPFSI